MDDSRAILIVDDNQHACRTLTLILRKQGHRTESAGTGRDAIEKATAGRFDLALVDIKLPDLEGTDLIAPLKAIHSDIELIMATAYASHDTAIRALNRGAFGYITKPINIDELVATINRVTEKQHLAKLKRQSDEALLRSERRYHTIFETAAASIWEEDFSAVKAAVDDLKGQGVTDFSRYLDAHPEFVHQAAQMLRVKDVNAATLRMFGAASKTELLGALDRVFVPETLHNFREEILAIAGGKTYFEGETINRTLHGERLNVLLTMTIPQEVAEFDRVLVTMLDITERVRAERELKKSQANLRDLYENAPNAYFSVGLDGRNRMCNRRAGDLLGYPTGELVGQPIVELCSALPSERAKAIKIFQRFRDGEPLITEELQMRKADGSPVWTSLTVNADRDAQGQIVGSRWIAVDITARKQLERDLGKRTEEIRMLYEAGKALGKTLNLDEIQQQLRGVISKVMTCDVMIMFVVDPNDRQLRCCSYWVGEKALDAREVKPIPLDEQATGILSRVIFSGASEYIADYSTDNEREEVGHSLTQDAKKISALETVPASPWASGCSALIVPIKQEDQVIGVLQVASSRKNDFSEDNLRFLETVSSQVAAAYSNARLLQEVEKLSTTDPLTGCNNRRYFDREAQSLFRQAVQHKCSLSALMLDIDNFKQVNDIHGHDVGDLVLKEVVRTCHRLTREMDLFARYGGEEFCFLLPEAGVTEAHMIAERLRTGIAALTLGSNGKAFSVTASFGVAERHATGDSLGELVKRSDEALLAAKRMGKNRTVVWLGELRDLPRNNGSL